MKLPRDLARTLATQYSVTNLTLKEVEKFTIHKNAMGLSTEAFMTYHGVGNPEPRIFRAQVNFMIAPDSLKASYVVVHVAGTELWDWFSKQGASSGGANFAEELAKQVANYLGSDFADSIEQTVSQVGLPTQS